MSDKVISIRRALKSGRNLTTLFYQAKRNLSDHAKKNSNNYIIELSRLLRDHHWFPVKQRIEYKLCMTVHRYLHGEAPRYSGRPHHAVCRSDRQSRLQIRHVWLCLSATYHIIT